MTTVAETKTDAQLLYLAIDLGDQPRLTYFAQQAVCVDSLARYCVELAMQSFGNEFSGAFTPGHDSESDPTPGMIRPSPGSIRPMTDTKEDLPSDTPGPSPETLADTDKVQPRRPEIAIVRTTMASPWVSVLAESSQPFAYVAGGLYALHKLVHLVMEWQDSKLSRTERLSKLLDRHIQAVAPQAAVSEQDRAQATAAIGTLGRVVAAEVIDPDDPRATGAA
jgi:hypothetical protein